LTFDGDEAAGPLVLRAIVSPPVGAFPVRVTVPVELCPPVTVVGLRLRSERTGALTVKVALLAAEPKVAEILAGVSAATGDVVRLKVAEDAPFVTWTVAGTLAAESLELSDTTTPPGGASPFNTIFPVELLPPVTLVGSTVSALIVAGVTVSVTLLVTDPSVASTVAPPFALTPLVAMLKLAVSAPGATLTLPGTTAKDSLDFNFTVSPLEGAGPDSVTEPLPA